MDEIIAKKPPIELLYSEDPLYKEHAHRVKRKVEPFIRLKFQEGVHETQDLETMLTGLRFMDKSLNGLQDKKICVLGTGSGVDAVLYALEGAKVYCIEQCSTTYNSTKNRFSIINFEKLGHIELMRANYFDKYLSLKKFKDDSTLSDMQGFVLCPYNVGHSFDVIFSVLAMPEIKIGAAIYKIDYGTAHDVRFYGKNRDYINKLLNKTGIQEQKTPGGVIKIKESELKDDEIVEALNINFSTGYERIR